MDIVDGLEWLASALREQGRPALAHLVGVYVYIPQEQREGMWLAIVQELSPTDSRERLLRDAVSALHSVGDRQLHRAVHAIERAQAAWGAAVAT